MAQNLDEFKPKEFGYVIIDECHHGTANTYKKVLAYFKPEFTLGLTATPDRMDGENLLEIFKNVAHKLDLKTAVEIGELVPIRCMRIKTNVDLSTVRINGIKYNSQDLFEHMDENGRVKLEDIVDYFIDFYTARKNKGLVVEKKSSIFCKEGYTRKDVERNILMNPFKRFEDMRFMKRSREIEYVEFNRHIFKKLTLMDIAWIKSHCDKKLEEYYKNRF